MMTMTTSSFSEGGEAGVQPRLVRDRQITCRWEKELEHGVWQRSQGMIAGAGQRPENLPVS